LPETKPLALFLTPEAPFPLAGGGSIRSASLLEFLSQKYSVDVVVFRQPGEPDPSLAIPARLARRVQVLQLPWNSRHPAVRLARTADRLVRTVPPLNDRFAGYGAQLGAFIGNERYRVALIEHFWCAPYVECISPHADLVVLDLHNIESILMSRRAEIAGWAASAALRRFARASRRLERHWLPKFGTLLSASDLDAARLQEISPTSRVVIYPNALPKVALPGIAEQHAVAFSGNLEYDPNADAVRYFHDSVWPLLRDRWPELVWRLIGKGSEAIESYVRDDPGIEIAGPPADAVEALAAAQVVVAPLRAGSGTRVKIVEAWAAARAVVATTLGAEGLPAKDGENILIADAPALFAVAVTRLLESPELRRSLGVAGRRTYEQHLTWPSAWGKLDDGGL
jgi:polysaccharide biosynthesis protein PslH